MFLSNWFFISICAFLGGRIPESSTPPAVTCFLQDFLVSDYKLSSLSLNSDQSYCCTHSLGQPSPQDGTIPFNSPLDKDTFFFFLFFFDGHFYLPAQLVGGFTLSDLLDKPWSQVSSLLPPGTCLQFLSRIGFSIPTARRFSSNVANSRSRAFR